MEHDGNSEGTQSKCNQGRHAKKCQRAELQSQPVASQTPMRTPNDACCAGFIKANSSDERLFSKANLSEKQKLASRNPPGLGLGLRRKCILSVIQKSAVLEWLINTLSSSERFVIRLSVDSSCSKKKKKRKLKMPVRSCSKYENFKHKRLLTVDQRQCSYYPFSFLS